VPDAEHAELQVAVQAVLHWLSQHPEGETLLARLATDRSGGISSLTQWLQDHARHAPPSLTTLVSGGRVGTLTNIAQIVAGVAVFQHATVLERPAALYQLPNDIADFTGRERDVRELSVLLEQAGDSQASAPVMAAVAGMAGVGKSTLAVHVAQLIKEQFPDAQLYMDLRGGSGEARNPLEVLTSVLRDIGQEQATLPTDLEGCTRRYRSALAAKRALIVLDNARDEQQVRPLLPGSATCAVLITSRTRLVSVQARLGPGACGMGGDAVYPRAWN
jgi:hypothetical protein